MRSAWNGLALQGDYVAKCASMSNTSKRDNQLFEIGPLLGLQRRLGFARGDRFDAARRAIFVAAIGWPPLVVFTVVQSTVFHTDGIASLVRETGVHARYLLAVPLLVVAEVEAARRLNATVHHFVEAGLVREMWLARFEAAVVSTRRLLASHAAEIVIVSLAYLLVAAVAIFTPLSQLPAWHKAAGVTPVYSPAGWWHVLVSLPLLLILLLGWMWRLVLWARLLWHVAGLDLHLVASHPDHAAGLGFVGYSVRAFSVVALAIAIIIAGRSAHIVLLGATMPTQYFVFNGGILLAVAAMFAAPLLVFSPALLKVWQRGALEYSALADKVGNAFEEKWLARDAQIDRTALERPDFSATTDLYSIVANVQALRLVPIDLRSVLFLCGAMLIPFVPVVLLALPIEQIIAGMKALIF